MNEEIRFASKIRQALAEGARLEGPRGAAVAARLRAARERALQARRPEPASALSWAGRMGALNRFLACQAYSQRLKQRPAYLRSVAD